MFSTAVGGDTFGGRRPSSTRLPSAHFAQCLSYKMTGRTLGPWRRKKCPQAFSIPSTSTNGRSDRRYASHFSFKPAFSSFFRPHRNSRRSSSPTVSQNPNDVKFDESLDQSRTVSLAPTPQSDTRTPTYPRRIDATRHSSRKEAQSPYSPTTVPTIYALMEPSSSCESHLSAPVPTQPSPSSREIRSGCG